MCIYVCKSKKYISIKNKIVVVVAIPKMQTKKFENSNNLKLTPS